MFFLNSAEMITNSVMPIAACSAARPTAVIALASKNPPAASGKNEAPGSGRAHGVLEFRLMQPKLCDLVARRDLSPCSLYLICAA